eukprot:g661.t1
MQLSKPLAVGLCIVFACLFVGVLHIFVPIHIRRLGYYDDRQIKWRMAVLVPVCLACPVAVKLALGCSWAQLGPLLGIPTSGSAFKLLQSIAISLGLTMTLFLGPIVDLGLQTHDRYSYRKSILHAEAGKGGTRNFNARGSCQNFAGYAFDRMGKTVVQAVTQWAECRQIIFAPVSEEWVFRSCMVAALRSAGFSTMSCCIIAPLFFGVAHLHHAAQKLREGNPARNVLFVVLFQMAYTSIFGFYAVYLMLSTGRILPVMIVHGFCNIMGFPEPSGRLISSVAYVIGILVFALSIHPLTTSLGVPSQ